MKIMKFLLGILALLTVGIIVIFVLGGENALVTNPKGVIAEEELHLIRSNIFLMLLIVVPTIALFYFSLWRYRSNNKKAKYAPEKKAGVFAEVMMWLIPSAVIAAMALITYKATFRLDPYRPLESETKELTIQVVALNWKWLFIYPEQGIATVNFVEFPARTPIHFELAADDSPMNSFWIPQLSGQIYAMTGMTTQLHLMANEPGIYHGRAAEINGKGLADMTFVAKATSEADFELWVASVKQSPLQLDDQHYQQLLKPSVKNPVTLYSNVEKDLFQKIVMKYMEPNTPGGAK